MKSKDVLVKNNLLYLFYFLSGFTALVYEVIWTRKLGLVFGIDAVAVSTVLAIYFSGLAAGSFLGGKLCNNAKWGNSPLKTYGYIEIAIGFLAILSLNSYFLYPLLFIPTVLMGMTYPLLVKAQGGQPGLLYAVNTLGAVLGAALSGFILIYFWGLNLTTQAASLINFSVGILAVRSVFKVVKTQAIYKKAEPVNFKALYIILAASGFASILLEVLYTRAMVMTAGPFTFSFVITLTLFLLGISLGGFSGSKLPVKFLAYALLLETLTIFLSISLIGNLPTYLFNSLNLVNYSYLQLILKTVFLSSLIIFPPTFLMGVIFTMIINQFNSDQAKVATGYAINTIFGVLASLASVFVIIPLLGVQKGILLAGTIYLLTGAVLQYKSKLFLTLSALLLVFGLSRPSWDGDLMALGVPLYLRDYKMSGLQLPQIAETSKTLFYKEGLTATVAVKKAKEGYLFLKNNGKADSSTDQDMDDMRLIGLLPLLLHANPRNVLVIGLGSGITAGSAASVEGVEVDVVEIEPSVITAAGYFEKYNNNVLKNPKVRIIAADARKRLLGDKFKYDVITSQPSNLWVRGNASLYTRDFFGQAKGNLNAGGLMLQWVPYYGFTGEEFDTLLSTFNSVFPYVTVWTPVVSHDVLLIGSTQPQLFNAGNVDKYLNYPKVKSDLELSDIGNSSDLFAHCLFDEQELKPFIQNLKYHTDDKPILELSSQFSIQKDTITENLQRIAGVESNCTGHFKGVNDANLSEVGRYREGINAVFAGKLKAANGELEESAKSFEKALTIFNKLQSKKELARIYLELARIDYGKGNIDKVLSYFERSGELNPNPTVFRNLNSIYTSQKRFVKAGEALNKAEELEKAIE